MTMPPIHDLVRRRIAALEAGDVVEDGRAKAEIEARIDSVPGARAELEHARAHAPIRARSDREAGDA